MPDGAGGAYLSLATVTGGGDDDYSLLRFTADGALAPGWPDGGVPGNGIRSVSATYSLDSAIIVVTRDTAITRRLAVKGAHPIIAGFNC